MFEKILYPTDFSNVSKKALKYIKRLKDAGAKEVVVLHVIDEREIESVSQHAGRHFNVEEVEREIRPLPLRPIRPRELPSQVKADRKETCGSN